MRKEQPAESLIKWYDKNRRILPWREDPTPFHVWLSEIMLQQTRVEAVKEYYRRFLEELPDIPALAAAEEETVLKLWEGLGYYSRARNLQKCAAVIMGKYGGRMPEEVKELKSLPGIGDYTAAAVAAIAFGKITAAVDGNLLRIFARMTCYEENIKAPDAKKAAEAFFLKMLPNSEQNGGENADVSENAAAADKQNDGTEHNTHGKKRNLPGDFNQALMDLGAMICLPNTQPRCGECPWGAVCAAHAAGKETDYPVMPPKKEKKTEKKTVLLIRCGEKVVLHKRPDRGLLAGMYEFPMAGGFISPEKALGEVKKMGFEPIRIRPLPDAKHIFTHKEWHMKGYEILADEHLEGFDHQAVAAENPDKKTHQAIEAESTSIRVSDSSAPENSIAKDTYVVADRKEIEGKYPIPGAFAKYREIITKKMN